MTSGKSQWKTSEYEFFLTLISTRVFDSALIQENMGQGKAIFWHITAQKMEFSIKFPAVLVTFTEGILNGKLHFLCSVFYILLSEDGDDRNNCMLKQMFTLRCFCRCFFSLAHFKLFYLIISVLPSNCFHLECRNFSSCNAGNLFHLVLV